MSSSNSDPTAKSHLDKRRSGNPNASPAVTQCRLLTGVGRSAIAVIELIGANADKCLDEHFHAATGRQFEAGQIRYGRWGDAATGESIVVTPMKFNHFEIQCHGGSAAIQRILRDMVTSGAVRMDPSVASDDRRSRWIAEAKEVLCHCTTAKTAAMAMDQVRGAFADFADEIGAMNPTDRQDVIAKMKKHASWSTRLNRPFEVVLVGPPNVGKSSLINAIVGYERSIVLDQPGTTRDVLVAETVIDGWPIRFRDTAGIRETDEAIEKEGILRARMSAEEADLVLRISTPDVAAPTDLSWRSCLSVLNKNDTASVGAVPDHDVATVAISDLGIDALQRQIVDALVPDPPPPGSPLVLTDSQRDWLWSDLA